MAFLGAGQRALLDEDTIVAIAPLFNDSSI
jgi:hypothetical protein